MSTKKEIIQRMTWLLAGKIRAHLIQHDATEFPTHDEIQAALDAYDWKGLEPLGCLAKADMDEPVFILRAHDPLFRETVNNWAISARRDGAHEPGKIDQAVQEAYAGELWRKAYLANLDAEDQIARERLAAEQGSDV